MDRGGTATREGNLVDGSPGLFENRGAGDLHLSAAASTCVDQGVPLPAGLCDGDIDGEARDAAPDIGADERR